MNDLATQPDQWISLYVYYHENRGRVLRDLVVPLTNEVIAERRLADRFFFVQYPLGGPHLRIRFRCRADRQGEVTEIASESTRKFLRACPSLKSLEEEQICRINHAILTSDQSEHDATIYPDNFFRILPFDPEIERYGGTGLLPHSLELFCASSLAALDLLLDCELRTSNERLYAAAQLLFIQAAGMAQNLSHLKAVLCYILENRWDPVVKKADQVYESNKANFITLIDQVSTMILGLEAEPKESYLRSGIIHAASTLLVRTISTGDLKTRATILGSQMHMTANRIGLRNADEVYLGRLLFRAAQDSAQSRPSSLQEAIASGPFLEELKDCSTMPDLVDRSLASYFAKGRGLG